MDEENLYITAEEAAARLNVTVTTVYAYVSRKLIRTKKSARTHRSLYWRPDIDRIARRGAPDKDAPDAGALAGETKLTLLTDKGHYYRGRNALDLADAATIEDVAALLWDVDCASVFSERAPPLPEAYLRFRAAHPAARPTQRAILALSLFELDHPRVYDLSPLGYAKSGGTILRLVAAAFLDSSATSDEPIHLWVTRQVGADAALADVVRQLLVLSADHELDPTAFAVRAVANTGVTPFAATMAGLLSSSGRRLTFGRADSLVRFFEEIMGGQTDPADAILRRIREGEPVPGFASRNYPSGDPRATLMLQLLRRAFEGDAQMRKFDRVIEVVHETLGAHPDFVLPATFLSRKIGLGPQHGSLVRLGRVVGWIAHAMEQYQADNLVRPHARYAGDLPQAR